MKGLYKGKYLIVYYDEYELPLIVSDSLVDFATRYAKYRRIKRPCNAASVVSKILKGERKDDRIKLIEADTVIDDCFKEEDEAFIQFVDTTREKTIKERCKESHISERSYYRKKSLIKRGC